MDYKISRNVTLNIASSDGGTNTSKKSIPVEIYLSEEFNETVVKGLTPEGVFTIEDLTNVLEDMKYVDGKFMDD